ncbi:hypothetical protein K1X76_04060 [bacterium]|nr:hypothetical protein [bacterium]
MAFRIGQKDGTTLIPQGEAKTSSTTAPAPKPDNYQAGSVKGFASFLSKSVLGGGFGKEFYAEVEGPEANPYGEMPNLEDKDFEGLVTTYKDNLPTA